MKRTATILAIAASIAACDPLTLTDEQRQLLTGTTDTGVIALTVKDPASGSQTTAIDVELTGAQPIYYQVEATNFAGSLSLSLSGLTADVELVRDLDPRTIEVAPRAEGGGDTVRVPGSFVVRAVGTSADPVDLFLSLVSVGTAGSRVEHPPVRVRLQLPRPLPDLDCRRTPESGPAPLPVTFVATPTRCTGECVVSWEFGDREASEQRSVRHVYERPGEYVAVGTVSDGPGRTVTCRREVLVTESTPNPTPVPSPSPAPPPTASFTFETTCCPAVINLDARGSTGNVVSYTWDLSWTPQSPDGVTTSPTTSFPFSEGMTGTITLTVTAIDGQTSSLTRSYPR